MWPPCGSKEAARRLFFPPTKSIQKLFKYGKSANQLPLADPLPWPRTALSEIRKAGRIDLMSYYWVHNEACQQRWQVPNILNEPCVIWIPTVGFLKILLHRNVWSCTNPMAYFGRKQSESAFCDLSPAGLFRQMMEGCSLWSTPRPTSHSPHVLHPPWQHAWAWHFGEGIYSEKSTPCPYSAPRIGHCVGGLKITQRYAWIRFCW